MIPIQSPKSCVKYSIKRWSKQKNHKSCMSHSPLKDDPNLTKHTPNVACQDFDEKILQIQNPKSCVKFNLWKKMMLPYLKGVFPFQQYGKVVSSKSSSNPDPSNPFNTCRIKAEVRTKSRMFQLREKESLELQEGDLQVLRRHTASIKAWNKCGTRYV